MDVMVMRFHPGGFKHHHYKVKIDGNSQVCVLFRDM